MRDKKKKASACQDIQTLAGQGWLLHWRASVEDEWETTQVAWERDRVF